MGKQAELLAMIGVVPVLASVLTAALGPRVLKHRSHWPTLAALGYALVLSIAMLFSMSEGSSYTVGFEWLNMGRMDIPVRLVADPLTAIMLVTVHAVALLVAIFSVGYMHDDPGYARYFSVFSLFVFCMVMLVMANNFLMLFIFWEGVGLCSYLLIGFWYQKPAAAAAARKAFLVNRIGDFGFLIAVFLIWTQFGTLNFAEVFRQLDYRYLAEGKPFDGAIVVGERMLTHAQIVGWPLLTICICLMLGAMGKSAQFPLHVWLPDAMEGPTPASALIHAATMVTAGVYLVARCTPIFLHAPQAQALLAVVGAVTALVAALIALTQNDLKRIMAYSTVSQLGYMFMALGSAAGNPNLATFAVIAAIFHLFTHAFFKALLFLGCGSVMHAMGGVIDLRRIGGLKKLMPWTHLTFAIGAAGLAGIPPLAGFWSKDEILVSLNQASHGSPYGLLFTLILGIAILTAFLTAFYTGRAYFLAFWGPERIPEEAGHHAHESGRWMLIPLFGLAAGTVLVGILFGTPTHLFEHFLTQSESLPKFQAVHGSGMIVLVSILAAGGGAGLAAIFFQLRPELPSRMAQAAWRFYDYSSHRFYLDEILGLILVRPLKGLAAFIQLFDLHVVDGLVDWVGQVPGYLGQWFRPVQNGLLQFYALASLLGLAVFVIVLLAKF